jgi:hypothetical protein
MPPVLIQAALFAQLALRAGWIPFETGATFGRSGFEQFNHRRPWCNCSVDST